MGIVCLLFKVTGKLQTWSIKKKKKILFELDTNQTPQKILLVQYYIVPFALIPKKMKFLIHSKNTMLNFSTYQQHGIKFRRGS